MRKLQCSYCRKFTHNVRVREKLDPRTLKPSRAVLCNVCAHERGYGNTSMGNPSVGPAIDQG